jgi:hypothetical protein
LRSPHRGGSRGLRLEAAMSANDVSFVGAVFDVPTNALPVRLIGVEALKQHVESEPKRGIADLLLAKHMDPAIDVLARDHRLELLDSHEILLVERAQPIDRNLQLSDQSFELALLH